MEKNNIIMGDGLIGGLFEGEPPLETLPALEEIGGSLCFKLVGDKCSFVLGSLAQVDFVVEAKGVAKEHVSFVMDINGVRIIPILHHKTLLNDQLVSEAQILSHGAVITIADKKFIFKEQADGLTTENPQAAVNPIFSEGSGQPTAHGAVAVAKKRRLISIKTFDALFAMLVISALLGTVFIYQKV